MKQNNAVAWLLFGWALLLASPTILVFLSWLQPQWQVWSHLQQTLLKDYVVNTILLASGVALGAAFIGTASAWLVSQYRFPMRNLLRWLLILPLAIPAYIMAYTYSGMLDYFGVVQSSLRELGIEFEHFWQVQSLSGAIVVMSLVLYPYVYALALVAFSGQPQSYFDVAKSHGKSDWQYFTKIALPLALPAIFAGSMLAMMEAFAEFGVVDYYGVPTLTTGVFKVWFGMNNAQAAAQLSALLVTFVLFLLVLEKWSRRKQRYYQQKAGAPVQARQTQGLWTRWLMTISLTVVVLLAFVFPVMQLASWAFYSIKQGIDYDLANLVWSSFSVALAAAAIIAALCLIMLALDRRYKSKRSQTSLQIVSLGYAFPGAVIAVGAMVALSWADRRLNWLTDFLWSEKIGLVLSGSLFALLFAYVVRFTTVGMQYLQTGYNQVSPSMDEAAQTMGSKPWQVFGRIHLPLLKPSIAAALLVVFVDVLKELPATLILRPFNFNTLAVKTYELASDERLADAAVPALVIISIGLVPVLFIGKNKLASSH